MGDEFGPQKDSILADLALTDFGDRTPNELLSAGVDPAGIWLAICQLLQVPKQRWAGLDKKAKNRHAD